jgi:hypothetical protein
VNPLRPVAHPVFGIGAAPFPIRRSAFGVPERGNLFGWALFAVGALSRLLQRSAFGVR